MLLFVTEIAESDGNDILLANFDLDWGRNILLKKDATDEEVTAKC